MRTVIPRRTKADAGALAAELGAAESRYRDTVEAAKAAYDSSRSSVLERGTQRAAELLRLEQEAREEREAIEGVIGTA